jgi:hypothetical protein
MLEKFLFHTSNIQNSQVIIEKNVKLFPAFQLMKKETQIDSVSLASRGGRQIERGWACHPLSAI